MMENNKLTTLHFSLHKITTEQFAVIDDVNLSGNIKLSTRIHFGFNDKRKMVACFSKFIFEADNKPFIIIEASCHFKIEDDSWNELLLPEKDNFLKMPKVFLRHFAMLTVGTTRGILHAKTENTDFNKFVIPTVNISTIILEDGLFRLSPEIKSQKESE